MNHYASVEEVKEAYYTLLSNENEKIFAVLRQLALVEYVDNYSKQPATLIRFQSGRYLAIEINLFETRYLITLVEYLADNSMNSALSFFVDSIDQLRTALQMLLFISREERM